MSDLIAFISARLDEDEAAAKAVEDNSAPWDGQWQPRERHALETYNGWVLAVSVPVGSDFAPGVVEHIARHDPARVLREVAAKRAVLVVHAQLNDSIWCQTCDPGADPFGDSEAWYPCRTVRLLAAVYGEHPDYRQEWEWKP